PPAPTPTSWRCATPAGISGRESRRSSRSGNPPGPAAETFFWPSSLLIFCSRPRRPECFRGAPRFEVQRAIADRAADRVLAAELQEIERRPGLRPRHRHGRASQPIHGEREGDIDRTSASADDEPIGPPGGGAALRDRDTGREAERPARTEHTQEAGDAIRIG